ncbi:MAG: MBL fold metallo-hydrolase [Armatimonadetes bacterium]|nr:MBL fold metallo-hydrolase [Armatimonadota bacterium]
MDLIGAPSVQVRVLASGSAGNAVLVAAGDARLLVDAGLSAEAVGRELGLLGLQLQDLTAVLLTHEHDDHARGAAAISRLAGVPVLANEPTIQACVALADAAVERFTTGVPFRVGGIAVEAFLVPHDAAEPVGFHLDAGGARVAVAMDLGEVQPPLVERCRGADLVLLEANYDMRLLAVSAYPWFVKNRILGTRGHLSNPAAAAAAAELATARPQAVVLIHVSDTNNLAPLARDMVRASLRRTGRGHVRVEAVRPNNHSAIWSAWPDAPAGPVRIESWDAAPPRTAGSPLLSLADPRNDSRGPTGPP